MSFIFLVISCSTDSSSNSTSLSITSSVDTTTARIGEKIKYHVFLEGNIEKKTLFPELSISTDSLQVKHFTLINEDGLKGMSCEITFWDTGSYWTPNYSIQIFNQDSTIHNTLEAEPIQILIVPTLHSTAQPQLKPIKGPVPVKGIVPLKQLILAGLILALLIGIGLTWKQRKNTGKILTTETPRQEDPFDRAYRRCHSLESEVDIKRFYVHFSHISRELIEKVFYVRTLEMTTKEIEDYKHHFPISDSFMNQWLLQLEKADLVKYAKSIPSQEVRQQDLRYMTTFIKEIKALSEI